MKIYNNVYPYPVLDANQDQDGHNFVVNYSIDQSNKLNNPKITAKFTLLQPEIANLITQDDVGFYLHVESPTANYRRMFAVTNQEAIIEIDPKLMSQKIELTGFILAKKDINYVGIKLVKGNPLAVSLTKEIKLGNEIADQALGTIIKVAVTKEKMMYVDLDQDEVFIYLPQAQFDEYVIAAQSFGNSLIAGIIFPSLVYLLSEMAKAGGAGMEDKRWFEVIKAKLSSLGMALDDLYDGKLDTIQVAEQILADPVGEMFDEIERIAIANE